MGILRVGVGSQPATPTSGFADFYVNSTDRKASVIDDRGIVHELSGRDRTNLLRNSGFWFCQRQGASATNTGSTTLRTAGLVGGLDGWGAWNQNANTQSSRTDTASSAETGLQGRFYGTWAKSTSTGKFFVSQMLEGSDTIAIRGQVARFQVWMKGSATQTVRLGVVELQNAGTIDTLPATFISAAGAAGTDPTLGTNLAYVAPLSTVTPDNATISGNALNCSVTTAWQRFGGCFTIPSTCKNILVCAWTDAGLTAGNGFSLAQCSLTEGYEVQKWAPRTYAEELARVERIFQKSFAIDTAPAQSVGVNTGEHQFSSVVTGAVAMVVNIPFRTRLRAAPDQAVSYNPAAANAHVRNVTDGADFSATTITVTGATTSCRITSTGSAGVVPGEHCSVHWMVDAAGPSNEFA